jgi:hypothetical protein
VTAELKVPVRTTLLAAILAAISIVAVPVAHADEPGVTDLICFQLALGQTPEQIAEELHLGDRNYSISQTRQTVSHDMENCN